MEEKTGLFHRLCLENREKGTITGVQDVVSFDESMIVADTDLGVLTIRGKELRVSRLTLEKGEIDLEGHVDSLVYSEGAAMKKSGRPFFARLFQ